MADRVIQSYCDSDGAVGPSVLPYQSAWMSHWIRTSYKPGHQAHDHLSRQCEMKEDDNDIKLGLLLGGPGRTPDISDSVKKFKEVIDNKKVDLMKQSLEASSKSLENEKSNWVSFSIFNPSRSRENLSPLRSERATLRHMHEWTQFDNDSLYDSIALGRNGSHTAAFPRTASETKSPSKGCLLQSEGTSKNPERQMKFHKFFERSITCPKAFRDDFEGSTSKVVRHRFDSGKTPIRSFMCRQEELNQSGSSSIEHLTNTNPAHLEHEHCNYQSYSEFLVHGRKIDSHPNSGNSGNSLLKEADKAIILHNPSMSRKLLPDIVGEGLQKMQNDSNMQLFASQSCAQDLIKSEKLYHSCYSLEGIPFPVRDVETQRISAAMDSVRVVSPKVLETTHHLLIAKNTELNLSKGGQAFSEAALSSQFKGNTFGEFLTLSTGFDICGPQEVKIQPLGSSTDSEGKENNGDDKRPAAATELKNESATELKNESSAETDTMDMDAFQDRSHFSGVVSSQSNKDLLGGQNAPIVWGTVEPAGEVGERMLNKDVPDINQELPALPAKAGSMDEGEPSTSRTQSLDAEHLLCHTDQLENSKSSPHQDVAQELEPSSRCVKRLKLSVADSSGHGYKNSKMVEVSSPEKLNTFFSRIMRRSGSSSEPMLGKCPGKEEIPLDRVAAFSRLGESSSVNLVKKGRDITLSHSWIQRWCHNRTATPQKKPSAIVVCEPQGSKASLDEFQKEQNPSIAAMALMGKAMNGFRPCQYRKRGSFIVWNT